MIFLSVKNSFLFNNLKRLQLGKPQKSQGSADSRTKETVTGLAVNLFMCKISKQH